MKTFKIGTRASPLALVQAQMVGDAISSVHPDLEGCIEIVPMTTTGDTIQDRTLVELGGKALFTKEIEEALLQNHVDIAIHSLKDMPYALPSELIIGAVLKRDDPRDAFISRSGKKLKDLSAGTKVGTASLRRQAQLLHHYPHLEIVPIRGNIETRLKKLENSDIEGLLLAVAGLDRLALSSRITEIMPADIMIPAVGQGVIAIECRQQDEHTLQLVQAVNHPETWQAMLAERSFMRVIEGSCRTPLGAYAEIHEDLLTVCGFVASEDGKVLEKERVQGLRSQAQSLGEELGARLKRKV